MAGMSRRIVVIQGHPDRDGHYCHALAASWSAARGRQAGADPPALLCRIFFRPHQEANALWLAGARPVKQTPIGLVEAKDDAARERWLARMTKWGERAW